MKKKTCFVVCPIGDPDTDTRLKSDDLFDLVIVPATEPFDFEVVRVDRIPGSGVITSEIVAFVQTSELCIIDLTDFNPNVFYECGRRHETGRPYVHLISAGQQLPFDLAGIRTIQYDLTTPRSAHKASQELRRFVEENEQSGYIRSSSVTLNSITNALDRIEGKVDKLGVRALAAQPPQDAARGLGFGMRRGPVERRMMEAITLGDAETALSLLPELEEKAGPSVTVALAAGMLANAGSEIGAETVLRVCRAEDLPADEIEDVLSPFSSAVGFYYDEDRETEIVDQVERFVERVTEMDGVSDAGKAAAVNQLQRVYHGLRRHEEAVTAGKRACELDPGDPFYQANVMQNLRELDRLREAEEHADTLIAMDGDELAPFIIGQIIRVLAKRDRAEEARALFERLKAADRFVAVQLLWEDDYAGALDIAPESVL